MLDELHVHDIALIEDATLSFSPHLTVLTGETGAGKTALLSALQLVTGCRADSKVVRDGATEAVAEARLVDEGEHVIRRRLSAEGRSRCTLDGSMATVTELADLGSCISIHGQHDQVELLQPATQLAYLDDWISDTGSHLAGYHTARTTYLEASHAYRCLDEAASRAGQELEFLRFTAAEIEKVSPLEGEYETLEAELPRLQHAEALATAVETALTFLHDDNGVLDGLATASNALERQVGIDADLDHLSERLDSLQAQLEDLARDLRAYRDTVDFDPRHLQDALDRLESLSGLMRRFGPGMREVFETWDDAKAAMDVAQASPERLEAALHVLEQAEATYREAASDLSQTRHEAAERFCKQLTAAVAELAMEGALFEFSFEDLEFDRWGEGGPERIELLYRPAPASSPRSLGRIASGGELSRILLALECIHQTDGSLPQRGQTLVFDEVDQGVGGVSGTAVARRLAQLARHAQVIVVTHLAQVAAFADEHYVVTKTMVPDGLPVTEVTRVDGDDRIAEIARMLAGTVDGTALDHARSLLADSRGA